METKEDLQDYIDNRLPDIIDDHLEVYKDRYYRKSLDDVVCDVKYNYDMSCEIESLEDELKRKITTDERTYFENQFVECLKKNFYE